MAKGGLVAWWRCGACPWCGVRAVARGCERSLGLESGAAALARTRWYALVCGHRAACLQVGADSVRALAFVSRRRQEMFFGFNTFDPRHSPAVSAHQESYSSSFTTSALGCVLLTACARRVS